MIRGAVVIDASVVVEYLTVLTLTDEATRFFAGLADPDLDRELWAPDLIYPEVVSALRRLVRRKSIPSAAGERAVVQLTRLPISVVGMAGLMLDAWKLRDALTIYDATYVALSRELGAPLVTADGKLAGSPRRPGISILHLRQAGGR